MFFILYIVLYILYSLVSSVRLKQRERADDDRLSWRPESQGRGIIIIIIIIIIITCTFWLLDHDVMADCITLLTRKKLQLTLAMRVM